MDSLFQQQLSLPEKTGVYLFLDCNNVVLYVGKAKNLKKRTKYYFKEEGRSKRFSQMIFEAVLIKYHITNTEDEAFLLEAQLIKEKQPKYNIQYKLGRTLYYITFSDHLYPRVEIKKQWEYGAIGPFLSYSSIRTLLQDLLSIFQIRTCSNFSFNKRKRPCLEYFSKKCSAPCMQLIETDVYNLKVKQLKDLFQGKNKEILKTLTKELKEHVKKEEFELAEILKNNINKLTSMQHKQGIFFENLKRLDIVLFCENYFYIESIVDGAIVNIEYRKYEINLDDNEKERYDVLFSYYLEDPKFKVISNNGILFNSGKSFSLKDKEIIQHSQNRFYNLIAEDNEYLIWRQILNLSKLDLIEAYDCSHYNSKYNLCGMVKWTKESECLKNEYQIWRYNKSTYNDLEVLEYGLTQRALQQKWPDLILIDGGKTQLDIAKKSLFPFKNIIAFSKGENRRGGIVYDYDLNPIVINNVGLLMFFEKIRQAAHNWAKSNAMYRFSSKY